MEIVFFLPLLMSLVACLCSYNFVHRIIGLKIGGDALAILVLSFNNQANKTDMSLMALATVSITTALVMLMAIVGEREFGRK